jgi:hypothetical protein
MASTKIAIDQFGESQYNRQTASYTAVLTDANKDIEMNVGSSNNLTVPANGTVPYAIGTRITVWQYGAGQTTLVPDTGVTLRSRGAALKIAGQYGCAFMQKVGTNEWYVTGDVTA